MRGQLARSGSRQDRVRIFVVVDPDNDFEIVTPQDAAARACILGVFDFRGRFERQLQDPRGDTAEANGMISGTTEWLRESGAMQSCSASERLAFDLAPGEWLDPELLDLAAWHSESLGSLLWALMLVEPVAYDRFFDGGALLRILPFLSDSPFVTRENMAPRDELAAMRDAVQLRAPAEIALEREKAQLWFWRARTTYLAHSRMQPADELKAVVSDVAMQAEERGWIVRRDDDFLAYGKPYAKLSQEEHRSASSLAMARLRALNWLCGHARDWDQVPTDT